ncbi:MAG: NAD(P)-dependent oxidoreductase [Bryobacteraceae bacterium]
MFRIGLTPDFHTDAKGHFENVISTQFGDVPDCEVVTIPAQPGNTATPEALQDLDAVLALAMKFSADSLKGSPRLAVIGRWGVGYDMMDVPALTKAGVALCITPNGVRRPVAEANLTMIFALAKNLFALDRMARGGLWRRQLTTLGGDIDGKVLGSVGCGNIGKEMFRIAQSLGFSRFIACDPMVRQEDVTELGVELVDMETLCRTSDFLTVNCMQNKDTIDLVAEKELRMMKPTAYLVNLARGGIVHHDALVQALRENWIAGAGIDVYPAEPPPEDDALFALDNVIVTPHALAWTELIMRNNGTEACQAVRAVMRGEVPGGIVNRDVVNAPQFVSKLERYK